MPKKQGYKARQDESLGARKGARSKQAVMGLLPS